MTLHSPVYPRGTRVAVRPGRLPIDARLVGRNGTVVALDDYRPRHYGVLLDGESQPRDFSQDELAPGGP
ncbi:MAG: hypothetical protein JSU98_03600 [Gemmatimonadales bacterium]|jgi:hypothetical protein|nr:MAG: hypothetical protein JSU98_03600 [Gemmatimonadales bacterium]